MSRGRQMASPSCAALVLVLWYCGLRLEIPKREFLCAEDYNEDYFDFSCLPGGKRPAHGSSWYTVCGTAFRNRCEYITVLGAICTTAFIVFYNYYFRTLPKVRKAKLQ